MLRGDIDQICEHTNDKQIDTVDILEPNEDGQSLRVVVDGPPGIGKTTLCRKLLNLWAIGELKQHYELVLYCPFRDQEIANASTLELLLSNIYDCTEVFMVTEWILQNHGDQLLIIFDGWDELSIEFRQTSLASKIICNKLLRQCSVIVTSRSYASSSLLKLNTISKHIEVKGFSKKEVNNVIQCTLPQLNKAIEIRNDVQSLCYIPLVCSIVVYVCKSSEGQLPKTLTKLYKKFIIETINRHVEIKQIPAELAVKLSSLPSPINNIFLKLCKLAYNNLKQNPPKLTFSSSEIPENYLGLMTSFAEYGYGKKTYQFLHLSIQEFLAAWWITKYEKTEELFKNHFENDHFRLCLRFVAGLTHLEHKSYQQYFYKPIDLQCKRKPLFGSHAMYQSCFHQNRGIVRTHHLDSDIVDIFYGKFDVLLLQLLYESQNTTLCHILAQSMINQSLCLYHQLNLSLFDILCLSYFLNNSNITWKYLDLGTLNEQEVQIITDTITNNSQQNQCKGLEIELDNDVSPETTDALFQLPFFCHIQHCTLDTRSNCFPLFSQLQQMNVLHFSFFGGKIQPSDQSRLQQFIETNTTVQELAIYGRHQLTNCLNRTIQSLHLSDEVPNETIEQLLKNNYTLKALSVRSKSTLNIHEVNTPIDALAVRTSDDKFSNIMKIKGLKCLSMDFPYPQYNPDPLMYPHLPQYPHSLLHCIFQSHPNLRILYIKLDTSESVNELFTILQTNTTLKALRIKLHEVMNLSIGLQDMLQHNKTIQYFHIVLYYSRISNKEFSFGSSDYLSYLTNGLSHNTNLQELMVPIPLSSDIKYVKHFFDVISQKTVTELQITFVLDQTYKEWDRSRQEREMVTLLCNYGIPLVTEMLNSHNTMRLLKLSTLPYMFPLVSLKQKEQDVIQNFYDTVFRHPSLQYVEMYNISSIDLRMILKEMVNTTNKQKLPIINVH